ncbi:MAG TPA: RHS repeat-associated core domain-containing protein, partial [Burkholderiales bacterium]|nr:RHS repeat-associated core domain-containing protein [Burkholderiales bacterium]
TTIWRWDGDPFGFLPASEDPDGNGQPFTLNLRFPGQYFDKETNLHYNYYRDYDPSTGRYIEPEPLGLVGDINLYRYSRNSPVRFFDPDGAQVIIPGGGVAPPPGGAAPGTPRKPRDDGSMSGLFPPNTFPPSNGNAVPSPDDPGDGRVPDRKPDLKPIPGEGTNPGPGPKQKGVCKFTGLATFEPSGCNARTLKCQYRCPNKGIKYLSATVYFDSANPAFLCEPTVPEFYFPWN